MNKNKFCSEILSGWYICVVYTGKMAASSTSAGPRPTKTSNSASLVNASGLQSLIVFLVLLLAWIGGFASRLFAVIRFESIIHEFDPWYALTCQFALLSALQAGLSTDADSEIPPPEALSPWRNLRCALMSLAPLKTSSRLYSLSIFSHSTLLN
jgi:hypothetical protein